MLFPSSTKTISVCEKTLFFFVFLSFCFPPLLVALLVAFVDYSSPAVLNTYIYELQVSPLGATILIAYFAVIYISWSMLHFFFDFRVSNSFCIVSVLLPHFLPFDRVINGLFLRYRYRRLHISHMRVDRFRQLVKRQNLYTVFITTASGPTFPMCKQLFLSDLLYLINATYSGLRFHDSQ